MIKSGISVLFPGRGHKRPGQREQVSVASGRQPVGMEDGDEPRTAGRWCSGERLQQKERVAFDSHVWR